MGLVQAARVQHAEDQPAAGPHHTGCLGECRVNILDELESGHVEQAIERFVPEGQRFAPTPDVVDVP
jgi:hypothetical protein